MSESGALHDDRERGEERARLRCSLSAGGLRQAVQIATELRRITDAAKVHRGTSSPATRQGWTVTLTTQPLPLTLPVVQLWEARMLAAERRWPGCRFLGWRTCWTPAPSDRAIGETPGHDEPQRSQRRSQREVVVASLLRCPPDERRGIVRGRIGDR